MKRDKFFDIAQEMYVEQFITLPEIAKRFGVNEKTIRRWRDDGNWIEKRKNFIENHKYSNEEIFMLVRKMLWVFQEDMKNKHKIDTSRLYKFTNLLEEVLSKEKEPKTIKEIIEISRKRYNFEKMID